jgi:hypothetical protein
MASFVSAVWWFGHRWSIASPIPPDPGLPIPATRGVTAKSPSL